MEFNVDAPGTDTVLRHVGIPIGDQMENLLAKVAEILEVDDVKSTDLLDNFEEWDSLAVLSVIVMIDSDYRINLTAEEIRNSRTGQGLLDLVARKTSK